MCGVREHQSTAVCYVKGSEGLGGIGCRAHTGILAGPNLPSEDRNLPYSASFRVRIAIARRKLRRIRQASGPTTITHSVVAGAQRARRADVPSRLRGASALARQRLFPACTGDAGSAWGTPDRRAGSGWLARALAMGIALGLRPEAWALDGHTGGGREGPSPPGDPPSP